jgi:hypothetical protein
MKVNGEEQKFGLCTNVMTHPNFGGRGLFKLMGRESLEYASNNGLQFCLGVPNDKAIRGHMGVGWDVVNTISFYECNLESALEITVGNIEVNKITEKPREFFSSLKDDKLEVVRNADWIKWRLNKPYSKFESYSIDTLKNKGYVIVKRFKDPMTEEVKMHIVDFKYDQIATFIELIKHVIYLAKKEVVNLLNLWLYDFNEERTTLEFLGFVKSSSENPIIIHSLGKEISLPEKGWHITLFDNDVY